MSGTAIPPSAQHHMNYIVQGMQNALYNGRGINEGRKFIYDAASANGGQNQMFNNLCVTAAQFTGFGIEADGKAPQQAIQEAVDLTIRFEVARLYKSNPNMMQQLPFNAQAEIDQLINTEINCRNVIQNYLQQVTGGWQQNNSFNSGFNNNQSGWGGSGSGHGGNLLNSFSASPNQQSGGVGRFTFGNTVHTAFSDNAFKQREAPRALDVKPVVAASTSVVEKNGVRKMVVKAKPQAIASDSTMPTGFEAVVKDLNGKPKSSEGAVYDPLHATYIAIRELGFPKGLHSLPIIHDDRTYTSVIVDGGNGENIQQLVNAEGDLVDFREMEVDVENLIYHDSHVPTFDGQVKPISRILHVKTDDPDKPSEPVTHKPVPKEDRVIAVDEVLPDLHTSDLRAAIKVTIDNQRALHGKDRSYQFDVINSTAYKVKTNSENELWEKVSKSTELLHFAENFRILLRVLPKKDAEYLNSELTKEANYGLNVNMGLFGEIHDFSNEGGGDLMAAIIENYGKEAYDVYCDGFGAVSVGFIRGMEFKTVDNERVVSLEWKYRVICVPFSTEDINLKYDPSTKCGIVKRVITPLLYDTLDTMLFKHDADTMCRNRGLIVIFKDNIECHVSRSYWDPKVITIRIVEPN